jgi:Iap family predicted aminopeptidase
LSAVWIGLVVGGNPTVVAAEVEPAAICVDADFTDRTIGSQSLAFAAKLAERGPRPAASAGESRTRDTVVAELEAIGLEVSTEGFEYQTFTIEGVALDLGGVTVEPIVLGLDPFAERFEFEGEAVVITDPAQASDELNGRIVVTNHPLMQLMIAEFEPAVVICVEAHDLESFVVRESRSASLVVNGQSGVLRSANVVARHGPRPSSGSEVLVTSHLDAYQISPGANDNGTGLGLMIELARAFVESAQDLEVSMTFVAFGAEENGVIGSRAYVREHADDLDDIIAVVNLDTLGGALGPVIATKPNAEISFDSTGFRVPDALRNRAWEGPEGGWRIIHPEIIPAAFSSNYPPWLHGVVVQSASDLGIEIVHLDLISDHRTFAFAGVPAISIQSKEHQIHSEKDTADALVAETIDSGARLAVRILCRLQEGRPSQ